MAMLTTNDKKFNRLFNARQKSKQKNSHNFFQSLWTESVKGNKRHITEIFDNNMWKGKRCFIVAGGPSVNDHDLSILENELTIGINRAYEVFTPTVLFAMDGRFYHWIQQGKFGTESKQKFKNFQGVKLWLDISNHDINNVFYVNSLGQSGVSSSLRYGLYHGGNSGYGALNLAIAMGANPIYLIGYDMQSRKGESHFHDGYPTEFKESMMKSFPNAFENNCGEIVRRGFKVINLNRKSKLSCFKFGDMPKGLIKKRKPVYVSFYTKDNIYAKRAKELKDSLWKYTLDNEVVSVDNKGSWLENVKYKPYFIKEMMDKHQGRPIVWIDCDGVIKERPELFNNIKGDFAFYHRSRWNRQQEKNKKELLSGTLYFKNNKRSRELVEGWIDTTKKNPESWDQKTLEMSWQEWNKDINNKTEFLPSEYCMIFDGWEKKEGRKSIIEHTQASRTKRREEFFK